MSYTVSFYNLAKRRNSTKLPGEALAALTCGLKDNTGLLRPTITINLGAGTDFPVHTWNYFYIREWQRYYWVSDIEFYHGTWYVSGECDVLASWRTEIGSTSAVIARAESQFNTYLPDPLLPVENDAEVANTSATLEFSDEGIVIVGVAGSGNDSFYALVPYMWEALYKEVFTANFATSYKGIWDGLVTDIRNVVFNPGDYITSAIWVPVDYSSISGTASPISLGYVQTAIVGKKISPSSLLMQGYKVRTPARHPQADQLGEWLNGNGYRRITLNLPGYGSLALDADAMVAAGHNSVAISYGIDCTGTLYYHVTAGKDIYVACNVGTAVGFGSQQPNPIAAIGAVGGAAAGAATGNIPALIAAAGSALQNALPPYDRICTGGSRVLSAIAPAAILNTQTYRVTAITAFAGTGHTMIGRPLAQVATINTLTGYILCNRAAVSCAATAQEIDQINDYLNGGFFYE